MITVFDYFQMSLIYYQENINFRKEAPNIYIYIYIYIYNVSVTAIAKFMPANLSILIITKLKNQNLSKTNDKVF